MRAALREVRRNRLRTALIVGAVALGITCLTALVGLGEIAKEDVRARVEALTGLPGTLQVELSQTTTALGGAFDTGDLTALATAAASTGAPFSPVVEMGPTLAARPGGIPAAVNVVGVGDQISAIRRMDVLAGRILDPSDIENRRAVVVLNRATLDGLGSDTESILGQRIALRGGSVPTLVVVGVVAGRAGDRPLALVPWTLARPMLDTGSIASVTALARTPPGGEPARTGARLSEAFGARAQGRTLLMGPASPTATEAEDIIGTLQLLLGAVAAFALLTAAVGLANVLVLSVTERRREIGIRRSVGATTRDIRRLFLTEAVVLTAGGGLLGVWLAIILTLSAVSVAQVALEAPWLPRTFPFAVAWGGIWIAGLTGLAAGWLPARHAARVPVVDALRGD